MGSLPTVAYFYKGCGCESHPQLTDTFMHIGVCKIRLRIPESHSLKAKRRVVKSLIARLKNRFNIAIAEVEALEAHQFAILAAVSVSNDAVHLNKVISHLITFVETNVEAELVDYETEFFF